MNETEDKVVDNDTGYPKDTLGFHHAMSKAIFGEDSEATKFLKKKADESPNGMNERVIQEESQIVYLLGKIHLQGIQAKQAEIAKENKGE